MPDPSLSIIVPAWNAERYIAKCLDAICGQTAGRDDVEVLVVDNGSTDGTAAIIRRYPVIYLHEPIASSYRARNLAIRRAHGAFLLFTDADCIPDPDWAAAALAATRALPGRGIYGGRVEMFRAGEGSHVSADYDQVIAPFDQRANIARGVCVTANWLSPAAALRDVGMFRADLKSGGDVDCARRLHAAGYGSSYVPQMTVRHPARATVAEILRKRRRVVGGRWQSRGSAAWAVPRWMIKLSLESASEIKRVVTSPLRWGGKLRLFGLVGWLWVAAMWELIRVACGGEPRRA